MGNISIGIQFLTITSAVIKQLRSLATLDIKIQVIKIKYSFQIPEKAGALPHT